MRTMESNEFRLNNWVYESATTRFPMQVATIGGNWLYLDFEGSEGDVWEVKPDEAQPIPITDEILEQAGFRKDLTYHYKDLDERRYLQYYKHEARLRLFYKEVNSDIWEDPKETREIIFECSGLHYLHQLQNAFFLATKTEMDIKL